MKIDFYKIDRPSDFCKAALSRIYFIDADKSYKGIKGVSRKRKGYAAVRTAAGCGTMDIYGKRNILLPSESLFVVPAWKLISYRPREDRWNFRWFEFEAPSSVIPEETVLPLPLSADEISFLDMILKIFSSGGTNGLETASALFTSVLYIWKNRLERHNGSKNAEKISGITEILRADPQKNYSIDDLAKKCALSVRRFREVFEREYGVSPKKYMLRIKMERAEELLSSTKMSVSAIAESVGYSDRFYFSRAFKEYFGYPPSSLRHQARHPVQKKS